MRVPFLLRILIVLLALGGVYDSFLALRIHNQDPSAAPPCAVTEKWDCGTVNHSRYAVFPAMGFDEDPAHPVKHHIPVATLGMIGYALIALLGLWAPVWLVLQIAEVGCFCAAILSYLEAFVIEKWCIYCVWSQTIIATIFVLCVLTWILEHRRKRYERSAVVIAR